MGQDEARLELAADLSLQRVAELHRVITIDDALKLFWRQSGDVICFSPTLLGTDFELTERTPINILSPDLN